MDTRSHLAIAITLTILNVGCEKLSNPAYEALARCEAAGDVYAATKAETDRVEEEFYRDRSNLEAKLKAELDPRAAELESTISALRETLQEVRQRYTEADIYVTDIGTIERIIVGAVMNPPGGDYGRVISTSDGKYDGPYETLYSDTLKATLDAYLLSLRGNSYITRSERERLLQSIVREEISYNTAMQARENLLKQLGDLRRNIADTGRRLNQARRERESDIATRLGEAMFSRHEEMVQLQQRLRLDEELAKGAILESNALREPGGPTCSWQFTE